MARRQSRERRRVAALPLLAAGGGVAACLLLGSLRLVVPQQPASPPAAPRAGKPDAARPVHRAALSATAGEGLADPGSLEFGELFERLVALSVRGIAARKAGEESEAARLEALAEKVLDLLRNRVPESDSAALHELTGILSEDHTERSRVCRALCLGLLRFGLARRLARFEHGGSRRALDDLVHALLACLPQDERIAAELSGLLIGARYLGIVHEQAILDLALTATEDGFLVPHVVRLLETLWRNLEASGARSSTELASLALLFQHDTNPSKRLAAMRHLLTAEGGRFRELVLQEILEKRDHSAAAELAALAASTIAPADSLPILERLSAIDSQAMTGAFMVLSSRAPKLLAEAYERSLADGTRPSYRAQLVTGLGFQGGAAGLDVARTAFANDPSTEVRTRAMLVISARCDTAEGERALTSVLEDRGTAGDSTRLGSVVSALENLAQRGDPNATARVAALLRGNPALLPGDRTRLRAILDRSLPDTGR